MINLCYINGWCLFKCFLDRGHNYFCLRSSLHLFSYLVFEDSLVYFPHHYRRFKLQNEEKHTIVLLINLQLLLSIHVRKQGVNPDHTMKTERFGCVSRKHRFLLLNGCLIKTFSCKSNRMRWIEHLKLYDFIFALSNSWKWLYSVGKPRDFVFLFNSFDKDIKSHNIDILYIVNKYKIFVAEEGLLMFCNMFSALKWC